MSHNEYEWGYKAGVDMPEEVDIILSHYEYLWANALLNGESYTGIFGETWQTPIQELRHTHMVGVRGMSSWGERLIENNLNLIREIGSPLFTPWPVNKENE